MAATTNIFLVFLLLLGGQTGIPLGMPPGPEDPLMYQVAPEDYLIFTSWASSVKPDPAANPTERWMGQPEIMESYHKLKTAILESNASGSQVDQAESFTVKLVERCLSNACAIYISKVNPDRFPNELQGGALLTLGDDAADLEKKLRGFFEPLIATPENKVANKEIANTSCYELRINGVLVEWAVVKTKYLAITIGEDSMQQLLSNLETPPPKWLSDLKTELSVERISSITAIKMDKFAEVAAQAAAGGPAAREDFENFLEISGVGSIGASNWISGLDAQGFLCRGTVEINGEPTGVFDLLSEEPMQLNEFGKIKKDPTILSAARISFPKLIELANEASPEFIEGLDAQLGLSLQEDLANSLDEFAYVYGTPNVTNPYAGWVLGIGASNEMELVDNFGLIENKIRELVESDNSLEMSESKVNGQVIYTLESQKNDFFALPDISWSLADGEILMSLDKASLRRHLRREPMGEDSLTANKWLVDNAFHSPQMDTEGPLAISSVDVASLVKIGMPLLSLAGGELFFPPNFGYSFADLPPLESLTKDMEPNISAVFRTPKGFEILTRQTYPGGSPGTAWAVLFAAFYASAEEAGSAELLIEAEPDIAVEANDKKK